MTFQFDSKVITFFALFILLLSACSTLKSKQRLVQKGYESIGAKGYGTKGMLDIDTSYEFKNVDLRQSALKRISKKQIRVRLRNLEQYFALLPDSSVNNDSVVDSFYTNKNKIDYILANNLQTKNIHFRK